MATYLQACLFSMLLLGLNCQSAPAPPAARGAGGGDFRDRLSKGKDVLVENQEIGEALDFCDFASAYTLATGAERAQIGASVTFRKCRFRAKVSACRREAGKPMIAVSFAKNLSFEDCTFDEDVDFRACLVQDLTNFANCTFAKKVNFEEGDFANYAIFTGCHFQQDVRFQNTFFRKRGDFLHAEFGGTVNFQGAVFALDAQFGNVKSYKSADFTLVQFNGHAFFNYAELHGRTQFDDGWFKGRGEFMQGKLVDVSMKNCRFFGQPRFDQANIDIGLDVAQVHWLGGPPSWTDVDRAKVMNYKP